MKRILAVLFALTLIGSCMSAVFADGDAFTSDVTEPASHILVAYFSATGTTRGVAEKLAEGLSADLYEIVPEEPYTDAGLNYNSRRAEANSRLISLVGILLAVVIGMGLTFAFPAERSDSWHEDAAPWGTAGSEETITEETPIPTNP